MSNILQPFSYDYKGSEVIGYSMKCPGCNIIHGVHVVDNLNSSSVWGFNDDLEKPTFTPSILVTWDHGENREPRRCHSFIREGNWQFLNDCAHELAGKTVPMVSFD